MTTRIPPYLPSRRLAGLPLLAAAIIVFSFSQPAWAGFELILPPPGAAPASAAELLDQRYERAQMNRYPMGAPMAGTSLSPMPSAPAAPVETMPIAPDTAPSLAPASASVYGIPPAGEMHDFLHYPHQPSQRPAATSAGGLYIDPYPLQQNHSSTAPHLSGPIDQAMMEQGGQLRGVATSGNRFPDPAARYEAPAASDAGPVYESVSYGSAAYDSTRSLQLPAGYQQPRPPVASAPQPEAMTPAIAGGFSEAVGFGRDLPLPLALSQVVPPEYSYNFAQNINVGQTVSWQGGKSWNVVLNEMLAPAGLRATISGNQVMIQSAV